MSHPNPMEHEMEQAQGNASSTDCGCYKSITDQLTERFKAAVPDAADHKVELQGYGFAVIGNAMHHRPYMPYKAGAEYPLKKGGTKWKSTPGNMIFRFCPFCGQEFGAAQ